MKKTKRLLFDLLLYLMLVSGLVLLYNPNRNNKHTDPSSSVQFVYQQF